MKDKRLRGPLLASLTLYACGPAVSGAATALRVSGSTTVNPVVAEAAQLLHDERGFAILVDTQGGSSGGIAMLGESRIEVAMSSRPLNDQDRTRFPEVDFVEHRIGEDAVALVVSADVWNGGVRSLSRAQMRDIYERRATSWSAFGGPERPIVFFNKEPGRGTWEVFASWLYGSAAAAPSVSFPEVGGNEEARRKVASTPGSLSQLSWSWTDDERVFALAIEDGGTTVEPDLASVAAGTYPMSRPLLLLTDGAPAGAARELVELLLSPRGQALVRRHGYLGLAGTEDPE